MCVSVCVRCGWLWVCWQVKSALKGKMQVAADYCERRTRQSKFSSGGHLRLESVAFLEMRV